VTGRDEDLLQWQRDEGSTNRKEKGGRLRLTGRRTFLMRIAGVKGGGETEGEGCVNRENRRGHLKSDGRCGKIRGPSNPSTGPRRSHLSIVEGTARTPGGGGLRLNLLL